MLAPPFSFSAIGEGGSAEKVVTLASGQVLKVLDFHLLLDSEHRVALGAVAGNPNCVKDEFIQVVIPQAGRAGDGQLCIWAAMLGILLVAVCLLASRAHPAFRHLWLAALFRTVLPIV